MQATPKDRRKPRQIVIELPKDAYTLQAMLDGAKWRSVVEELDRALRHAIKYKYIGKAHDAEAVALQEIRDLLRDELAEEHLTLEE
jgi:hypothetical protein